jgi:MFS family permease
MPVESRGGLLGWAHSALRAGFDKDAEMTTDNPFATPHAPLTAPAAAAPSTAGQPLQFVAAMIVAAAVAFIGGNAVQWIGNLGNYRERLPQYLPMLLGNWLGGLVFYAAAVLLLVHYQRERHGIARFQPMAGLLVGFGVAYLIATVVVSTVVSYLSVSFYQWAFEQDTRTLWMALYGQVTSLISLVLGCLLPLWLALYLARSRSERLAPGQVLVLPSWHLSLGVALCFSALIYKVSAVLSYAVLYLYVGADSWLLLSGCLLPFAIVMAAVHTRLPPQVTRFAAGRVLACALLLLVLWVVVVALVSVLVAFAAYSSLNASSLPLYLLPPAILLLALLWPLARWCTGWFFAEQLAQSSPR